MRRRRVRTAFALLLGFSLLLLWAASLAREQHTPTSVVKAGQKTHGGEVVAGHGGHMLWRLGLPEHNGQARRQWWRPP